MPAAIRRPLLILALLAFAVPAAAQLTVSTDRATYAVGDVVGITIHNAGPEAVLFVSSPACVIWNLDTLECVHGCVGLPILWYLEVGESTQDGHDTGTLPDAPGRYCVGLNGTSDAPGSILTAEYELTTALPEENRTWGVIKRLYR